MKELRQQPDGPEKIVFFRGDNFLGLNLYDTRSKALRSLNSGLSYSSNRPTGSLDERHQQEPSVTDNS